MSMRWDSGILVTMDSLLFRSYETFVDVMLRPVTGIGIQRIRKVDYGKLA